MWRVTLEYKDDHGITKQERALKTLENVCDEVQYITGLFGNDEQNVISISIDRIKEM
jgi:hypothetical protein